MDPVSLLLVGGLALILVFQFNRVRKQQREMRDTRSALEVGAEVLTAAGMVATVASVDEATVTLRSADGHLTRWVKGAAVRVLPDTDPVSSRYQPPAGTGTGTTDTGAVDDDGPPRHQD